MEKLDKKLNELRRLFQQYYFDELCLCDLIYLDELFDDLVQDIRLLKDSIVDDRFRELDNHINRGF